MATSKLSHQKTVSVQLTQHQAMTSVSTTGASKALKMQTKAETLSPKTISRKKI